ncbi:MAG: hypothetical protein JOZ78_03300 [Chroococcidiopsidaceae cyanobacterium CP_BM_ER_R8_30]|nr:hypothetical protein [Chroococcidiopsidaceae cyanobacterium CP_BM_ER_R8_30]
MKLNRFWNAVMNRIARSSKPQVTYRCDTQGNWYYQVYDPQADKHNAFGTEQEVKVWLD